MKIDEEYIGEVEALYHCTVQGYEHLQAGMDALVAGNAVKSMDFAWRARNSIVGIQNRLWDLKEAMREQG